MATSLNKVLSLSGAAIWFTIAPGLVAGLAPWLIIGWEFERLQAAHPAAQIISAAFIVPSAAALVESFIRFALKGEGTPAPLLPTTRLVVSGFYRRVRNPMYVAVIGLILGQAILFGSALLVGYAAIVWLVLHLYVVVFEETRLQREFAHEYDEYCRNVKRWLPRLTPWRPERKEI